MRNRIYRTLNMMALGTTQDVNGHTVQKFRLEADQYVYYIVDGDIPMTLDTAADYIAN